MAKSYTQETPSLAVGGPSVLPVLPVGPRAGESNALAIERLNTSKAEPVDRGVRIRDYSFLFDGSNEAERVYLEWLPRVTSIANAALKKQNSPATVTPTELATNFSTEGGILVLKANQRADISGYESLGIDTLVSNLKALAPFITQQAVRVARMKQNPHFNEHFDEIISAKGLTLVEGALYSSAMYAWAKHVLALDLQRMGTDIAELPGSEQFFWGTVYFNTGPGTGRGLLEKMGLKWAYQPWPKGKKGADPRSKTYDEGANPLYALYNAQWRTAVYEELHRTSPGLDRHGSSSAVEEDKSALDLQIGRHAVGDPKLVFGSPDAIPLLERHLVVLKQGNGPAEEVAATEDALAIANSGAGLRRLVSKPAFEFVLEFAADDRPMSGYSSPEGYFRREMRYALETWRGKHYTHDHVGEALRAYLSLGPDPTDKQSEHYQKDAKRKLDILPTIENLVEIYGISEFEVDAVDWDAIDLSQDLEGLRRALENAYRWLLS